MAVSVETAKREICGALIDVFKLRAAPFLEKVQNCKTMWELREVIFVIIDDASSAEPEKANTLVAAWRSLDEI